MITKTQAKGILIDNLNDIRISALHIYLNDLIKRDTFGGGIEQYRIKDKNTDSYVTSFEQFISLITENDLTVTYDKNSYKNDCTRVCPIAITPENMVIEVNENSFDDIFYFMQYGRKISKLVFLINYMNDGDTTLPMKLYQIRLA